MDASVEALMNDALVRVRDQIVSLERRLEAQDSAGADVSRRQVAWAHEQLALDDQHAEMYLRAQDALQDDVARHELAGERLRMQNKADAEMTQQDDAELAEIRNEVSELRKTLAVIPAERAAEEEGLRNARHTLGHRLDSS
jgi:hypothetical protein